MDLLNFLKHGPRKKRCARCGRQAAHGYSQVAESDPKQVVPLCLTCLSEQLRRDYEEFRGRAIVIEPATGLPCYVFREQRISSPLLQQIHTCAECKAQACCLWMQSQGLTLQTFSEILDGEPERTLLSWGNPGAESLCGRCIAMRIGKRLQAGDLEFFEVCSPHDGQEGLVLPTAY
jgi:hypothetical protein